MTVIVAEALDLEGDQRRAFLASALAEEPSWRGEVESLLAEHDEDDGDFLSIPLARGFDEPESTPTPERIGRYRIVEVLGEGGMGTVYLAEQNEPVRRRVALKVIRRLRRPGIRERFAAECQALAHLKHPNIAAMYEAGTVDGGEGEALSEEDLQPYVAMEWVEGEPIHSWCDARWLGIEARLRLILGVCAGLNHAHGKGVLHCDLKPSNVLVTDVDGQGVPKVIDFGIARAIDGEGQGTRGVGVEEDPELRFFSPLYSSPEAIASGRRRLDVRSEVYSLGLLFYELLIGALPFEDSVSLRERLRRTSEEEPPAPSRRVAAMDAERAEEIAQGRSLSSRRLQRRLEGDLDAIILKAMARDPVQRYASVRELASDLERHLGREPVMARPSTAMYVAQRFARRHLGPLLAATLLFLALFGGLVARTVEARRAQAASLRATAEAEKALIANAEAEQVRDFLIDLFKGSDVERPGGSLTLREVLDRAADELRHGDDLHDQPLVRARLLQTIGTLYTQQGQLEPAAELVREALDLRLDGLQDDHPDVTESRSQLGVTLRRLGRFDEAEPLLVKILEIRLRDPTTDPELVAQSHTNLGNLYWQQERFADAEAAHRSALEIRQRSGQPIDVAQTLTNLGLMIQNQGRMAEARSHLRRAADLYERELGADHPRLGAALNNLGMADRSLDSWADAEGRFRRAAEIFVNAYGPGHPWAINGRRNLIEELILRHRWTEALDEAHGLVTVTEEAGYAPGRGDALAARARVERLAGSPEEALRTLRSAEDLIDRELSSNSARRMRNRTDTARVLAALGRSDEALDILDDIESEQVDLPAHHITRLRTEDAFGEVLHRSSRLEEAAARYRRIVRLREAHLPQSSRQIARAYSRLGVLLAAQGHLDKAAGSLESAIELFETSLGVGYPELSDPLHELGRLKLSRGNTERARQLLERAVELRRRHYPADDRDLLAAESDLVALSPP